MSRFDYIKYDDATAETQARYKEAFSELSEAIEALGPGRPQSVALTKLEESYMWVGKALRDQQLSKNQKTALNESRAP